MRDRTPTKAQALKESLPYGKWRCEDGSEVLFNRRRQPIWRKTSDGAVLEVHRDVWVPGVMPGCTEWYFNDGTAPYGSRYKPNPDRESRRRSESALAAFGVRTDEPYLVALGRARLAPALKAGTVSRRHLPKEAQ